MNIRYMPMYVLGLCFMQAMFDFYCPTSDLWFLLASYAAALVAVWVLTLLAERYGLLTEGGAHDVLIADSVADYAEGRSSPLFCPKCGKMNSPGHACE